MITERLLVGEALITLVWRKGEQVGLLIEAPRDVKVERLDADNSRR